MTRLSAYDARVLWKFGGYEASWGVFPGSAVAMRRLLPGAAVTTHGRWVFLQLGRLATALLARLLLMIVAPLSVALVLVRPAGRTPRVLVRRIDRTSPRSTRGPDGCHAPGQRVRLARGVALVLS